LSEADQELCSFARDLTLNPELSTVQKVEVLKREGFTDRAILDATLAVAYFNFVNRIVLGLGLQVNASEITGYKY
jgi:alkylhydroperoxidase family enzyme